MSVSLTKRGAEAKIYVNYRKFSVSFPLEKLENILEFTENVSLKNGDCAGVLINSTISMFKSTLQPKKSMALYEGYSL